MLTHGISPDFSGCVRLLIPSYAIGSVPSLSSHENGTDDIHCGKSVGTGPVALKVVPVTGAAFARHYGPTNIRLSFSTPT